MSLLPFLLPIHGWRLNYWNELSPKVFFALASDFLLFSLQTFNPWKCAWLAASSVFVVCVWASARWRQHNFTAAHWKVFARKFSFRLWAVRCTWWTLGGRAAHPHRHPPWFNFLVLLIHNMLGLTSHVSSCYDDDVSTNTTTQRGERSPVPRTFYFFPISSNQSLHYTNLLAPFSGCEGGKCDWNFEFSAAFCNFDSLIKKGSASIDFSLNVLMKQPSFVYPNVRGKKSWKA